jgi:hypothetical protein
MNERWDESHPKKIGVRSSEVFLRRRRWSPIVQGLSCGSKGLWTLSQDNG